LPKALLLLTRLLAEEDRRGEVVAEVEEFPLVVVRCNIVVTHILLGLCNTNVGGGNRAF